MNGLSFQTPDSPPKESLRLVLHEDIAINFSNRLPV